MAKSPDAFRTISEVADWLGVQAHVLRFWESKFSQVKPIKRAGGRRYYRPTDMLLIGGIKKLLHDDGLTIKGVQKILREEGMSHVADMSQPLDDATLDQLDDVPAQSPEAELPVSPPKEEKGVVLNFGARETEETLETEEPTLAAEPEDAPDAEPEEAIEPAETAALEEQEIEDVAAAEPTAEDLAPVSRDSAEPTPPAPAETQSTPIPSFMRRPAPPEVPEPTPEPEPEAEPEEQTAASLPAFLRRPLDVKPAAPEADEVEETVAAPEPVVAAASEPEPEPEPEPAPKPRVVELAPFTPEAEFDARPATLAAVYRQKRIGPARARKIAPLLDRLSTLRDGMNAQRRTTPPQSN